MFDLWGLYILKSGDYVMMELNFNRNSLESLFLSNYSDPWYIVVVTNFFIKKNYTK